VSIKTSLIVGWLSFKTYLDEGVLKAAKMGLTAAWNTWRGDYDLIGIEEDTRDA
jgi:hypothetical protein